MKPVRIILYEDNEALRNSMQLLLHTRAGYEVCGSFPHANNIEEEIKELQPDLVIIDIDMPGRPGTEAVSLVKNSCPGSKIIMHTVFDEDDKLFMSLCAGANGYVLKKTSPEKFLQYVEEALQGGAPFSPQVAQKVLKTFQQQPAGNAYLLSQREKEVLAYLVKGFTYKAISAELDIALDTVRKHIRHIYEKLHVSCGREAVALALRQKII